MKKCHVIVVCMIAIMAIVPMTLLTAQPANVDPASLGFSEYQKKPPRRWATQLNTLADLDALKQVRSVNIIRHETKPGVFVFMYGRGGQAELRRGDYVVIIDNKDKRSVRAVPASEFEDEWELKP